MRQRRLETVFLFSIAAVCPDNCVFVAHQLRDRSARNDRVGRYRFPYDGTLSGARCGHGNRLCPRHFGRGRFYGLGTATMLILLYFIRRLPYGVRSTISSLRQIKPSMEEAAINLGAPPLTAFLKVTIPLIMPGLIVGSLMSFITAINELSGTLIIYDAGTLTMPVKIYLAVLDGEFGLAAALSHSLVVMHRCLCLRRFPFC